MRIIVVIFLFCLFLNEAWAASNAPQKQQGFFGPSKNASSTVQDILQSNNFLNDQHVTLTGNITSSLGGELYQFKDKTGTITVDIDEDKWYGLKVTPQSKVTIYGEVEKEYNGVKIDVDSIREAN